MIGLVVGLWLALSFPREAGHGRDVLPSALAWVLVAAAVLLLITATLAPPTQR